MAEPSIAIEKHSEYIGKQCPGCMRGVEEGQIVVLCPRCKAPHHEDCWYDSGGCGKVGCRGVASGRPTSAQSALSASARSRAARSESDAPEGKKSQSGTIVAVIAVLAIALLVWWSIR